MISSLDSSIFSGSSRRHSPARSYSPRPILANSRRQSPLSPPLRLSPSLSPSQTLLRASEAVSPTLPIDPSFAINYIINQSPTPVGGHADVIPEIHDPSVQITTILESLRSASQSHVSAKLLLGLEAFKRLNDIAEGIVTPTKASIDDLDELRRLWSRGHLYFGGGKLIVKYPDTIHETVSRFFGSYFTDDNQQSDFKLVPTGSASIKLPGGGVKQPDESFAVIPRHHREGDTPPVIRPNLALETENTHEDARVAVADELCTPFANINQAVVIHVQNDDNKKGPAKQIVRIVLEQWELVDIRSFPLKKLESITFLNTEGEKELVEVDVVYGVGDGGRLYKRRSSDIPYSKCCCFRDNGGIVYKAIAEAMNTYTLFGDNKSTEGKLEFTYGDLLGTDNDTIAVTIPIVELGDKVTETAISLNAEARSKTAKPTTTITEETRKTVEAQWAHKQALVVTRRLKRQRDMGAEEMSRPGPSRRVKRSL
ncbi:hypothetical protein CERSUDRAFT_127732 [Gelatoporia subvermispora B]|uniref:Uncharacterized protein n=1 Tax=Ceriporiopsis subvermispora (strain B) TaxID=914234 RepID=M2QXZ7_CERS8|nr:hypothetical protein CERSUDRAFT_127732 [Gelatoporia subvermispora B]